MIFEKTLFYRKIHTFQFSIGLIILLCIELWIVGWTISMRETLPNSSEYEISNSFHLYFQNQTKVDHIWNKLQANMKCCGIYGVMDYRHASSKTSAPTIPWACCTQSENPHESFCKQVFQRGCLQALTEDTKKKLMLCSCTSFITAMLQVNFQTLCD